MSSYIKKLKHPKTGKEQVALCIDDFFGGHQYGYGFRIDGKDADWKTELSDCDFFRDSDFPPVDNQEKVGEHGHTCRSDGKYSSIEEWENAVKNCPICNPKVEVDNQATNEVFDSTEKLKDNQGDWEEELEDILDGIEEIRVGYGNGWWETSVGAEFGAGKLRDVKDFIRELLKKQKDRLFEEVQMFTEENIVTQGGTVAMIPKQEVLNLIDNS